MYKVRVEVKIKCEIFLATGTQALVSEHQEPLVKSVWALSSQEMPIFIVTLISTWLDTKDLQICHLLQPSLGEVKGFPLNGGRMCRPRICHIGMWS